MIEGVIVITTMLVFLGLIVFMRTAYGKKLDLQQGTRANVLYYSSHGCTGPKTMTITTPSPPIGPGSGEVDKAASKSKNPDQAAASRTWNSAMSVAIGVAVWGTVWDVNATTPAARPIDLERKLLVKPIHAESFVTCNEKKYDSQWKAWYQFGADFVSRGFGGVGDIFK